MKNLREEWLDKVSERLRDFSAEPDAGTWEKIVAGLENDRDAAWIPWVNRGGALIAILAFSWLLIQSIHAKDASLAGAAFARQVAKAEIDEKNRDHAVAQQLTTDQKTSSVERATTGVRKDSGAVSEAVDAPRENTVSPASGYGKNPAHQSATPITRVQVLQPGSFRSSEASSPGENAPPEPPIQRTEAGPGSTGSVTVTKEDSQEKKEILPEKRIRVEATLRDSIRYPDLEKESRRRPFTFYVSATPMLTYQKLSPFKGDRVVIDNFVGRPVLSADRFGASLEAGIQGLLTPRLEYYTGLHFYHQSQTLAYDRRTGNESFQADHQYQFNYSVSPQYRRTIIEYDMLNAGLEAGFIYHIKGEKLKQKVGAGVIFEQGFGKSQEAYDNAKSRYLFYELFYRNEYVWQRSISLFVQPMFSYSFASREKLSAPFGVTPYRAGITLGLVYRINAGDNAQ